MKKVLADLVEQKKIIPYLDTNKKSPRKVWNTVINGIHNVPAIRIDLNLLKNELDET